MVFLRNCIFLFVLTGLVFVSPSMGFPLTPQEKRGKEIYFKGTSPSGKEIKAFLGIASVEAPGAAMPCVNCHGDDGLGRPEAGITPSNITWNELTKSYGIKHFSGREHPAYKAESLGRAITRGGDPAENRLNSAMPIYSMPPEDLEALIVYLKRLGTELDPGLTETSIRIGTILPAEGPFKEMAEGMRRTVQACFDEINEKGGIYNRKLELVVARTTPERPLTKEWVRRFIQEKEPFALVTTFTPGLDDEMPLIMEEESIPLVGPFTLFPQSSLSLNRYLFYLFSGLREQLRALIDFAASHFKVENPRVVVLHPPRKDLDEVIDATIGLAKERKWNRVSKREYSPGWFEGRGIMEALRKENVDIVLFLGVESEVSALLREAKALNWAPYLLLPGVLAGKGIYSIPSVFRDNVILAYPTLPEDRKERGMQALGALARKYSLPATPPTAQISAYAAVQILLEGLRRTGRELSRERFVSTLERMYEFETGLTPPITYGPNRHIGAMGAYVVTVDPDKEGTIDFISSRKWVAVD